MSKYSLKYGKDIISFELPGNWHTTVLKHKELGPLPMEEALLNALEHPINEKPFADWLSKFKNILLVVPDITRYAGTERILPILYEKFFKNIDVKCIFALGNHRRHTEDEQKGIVSEFIYKNIPCFDHDCFNKDNLISVGRTSSGLEVLLNSSLIQAEAAIVMGSINFHYLAGFGGGRKTIFPGISGYETILEIHRKVFNKEKPGKHPLAKSGILGGNPMHEEIMEGISLIRTPMFLINTVLDDKNNLLNIFTGNINEAHVAGCKWFMENFGCRIEKRGDIAIVSAGGFPKDINFIQAHKAIEHAMGAVRDKGTIIVAGKCEDGLGNDDFLRWFEYPTTEEMEFHVRKSDKVYAQTAYATRLKAKSCNIVLVSELEERQVKRMGITPKKTIKDAIGLVDKSKEQICYIIPNGSNTLIL
jgi:nickel-dependent lactate racemase